LAPGTYSAAITISGNADNSPQVVTVSLTAVPGSIAWWCFDDCTASDCSGHGLNGTNSGAACVAGPNACGSAFEFTGSDQVTIPASFDDSITAGLSVTAWLYWYGSSIEAYVFDARDGTTGGFIWYVNTNGTVTFYLRKSDGSIQIVTSLSSIPIDDWTHVAVTFDDAADLLTLFTNGDADNAAGATAPYSRTGASAAIGNNRWVGSDRPFDGIIDEVRFYDEALSDEDAQCLMRLCP
jgi:hypothetical protein